MKHLKTFRQLNELKSLDSYDANTFISNKLIEFLNKLLKLLVADDEFLDKFKKFISK